ncbi:hypothetical protein Q5P01_009074 [Channa striata]|uniref:Protein FAM53C n=1 Tax=Channa striata TaxID=64152 RepID=A0AA88N377_CHASR|nr:hypothetical protein Q5P01_009074 [Channa striata]
MCHYLQWVQVPLFHGVLVDRDKILALKHNSYPNPTFWMTHVNMIPYGPFCTLENLSRDQIYPLQTKLSKAHFHRHLQSATAGLFLFQRTYLSAVPSGIPVHPRFGSQSSVAAKVEEHLVQDASVVLLPPQPCPASALTYGCSGMENPALSPSPTSACSTPSSSRRDLHPALPRCHSQPCDMRRPRLKRRHDPDVFPCPRPGLDFTKMTQIGNRESLVCSTDGCIVPASSQTEQRSAFSPAEFLGRASIGPLSESEEEEDTRKRTLTDGGQKIVFERDCTDLDLNLIEEN